MKSIFRHYSAEERMQSEVDALEEVFSESGGPYLMGGDVTLADLVGMRCRGGAC